MPLLPPSRSRTIRRSRRLIGQAAFGLFALLAIPSSWCLAQTPDGASDATAAALSQAPAQHQSPSVGIWRADEVGAPMDRRHVGNLINAAITLGLVGLLPLVALMATSYVRLVIVLGLLRQAIGGTHAPPAQVVTALALFLTVLVMAPVWSEIKTEAIDPYMAKESSVTLSQSLERGVVPVKRFMSQQIIAAGNGNDVWMFYQYLPPEQREKRPETFNDVPLQVLLPAFLISELKIAFAIGFQIFLPFLIVDLLVTGITTSMGMIMLPPATISLPLKLALFVTVDGWHLLVGMLMQSFAAVG
jgi:flagellar biosynthetic protein FliP